MISLFCQYQKLTPEYMIEHNGNVIIKHPVEAYVKMARNEIWYLTITFPKSDLLGFEINDESVFKLDLNYAKNQLFRTINKKYNEDDDTYTVYANHIFFDAQKEVFVFDNKVVNSTWDSAVNRINSLINTSGSEHPYKVYGQNKYFGSISAVPEDGATIILKNYAAQNFALDVRSSSEDADIWMQMYTINRTPAQSYILKKVGTYQGNDVYGILCVCSSRWLALTTSGKVVTGSLGMNPQENEKWIFIRNGKAYEIAPLSNMNYRIYPQKTPIQNYIYVNCYETGPLADKSTAIWCIENSDAVTTAYWERYNIIQCIFGTEDNSLMNRWKECEKDRYTAMFDNYNCYFGSDKWYPDNLQPVDIQVSSKRLTNYTKEVSMEKVVTGMIPKAFNGRLLPNNEIVKSDMWDRYFLHRIEVKEYSDIKLIEDDTQATKADVGTFKNAQNMYAFMRMMAEKDLKYNEKMQYPTTETTCKVEDLFGDDNIYSERIKLNDVIHAGTKEIFYINELTYDLITQKATDMKLVPDTEV